MSDLFYFRFTYLPTYQMIHAEVEGPRLQVLPATSIPSLQHGRINGTSTRVALDPMHQEVRELSDSQKKR